MLVQLGAQLADATFQLTAMIDMYVSRFYVTTFKHLDNLVEQLANSFAVAAGGGHNGHTQQSG